MLATDETPVSRERGRVYRLEDAVLFGVDEGTLLLGIFSPQQEYQVFAVVIQPVGYRICQFLPTLEKIIITIIKAWVQVLFQIVICMSRNSALC